MKLPVITFLFIISLLQLSSLKAQTRDCGLRISVLTCTPGQDLYSLFGHNALRITDLHNNTDIIYNWGTFDFNEPGFYTKFMRGKLLYFLSPDKVQDFVAAYQYEGRGVTEQVLDISCEEKQQIKAVVEKNMQGNNRFYKYDFLFDNCTTRIRDILKQQVPRTVIRGSLIPPGTTFRNMLHHYLDKGSQPWSKLGIDILLGSRIDRAATDYEAMFLPEYLMKGVDSSYLQNRQMVSTKQFITEEQPYALMQGVYKPLITISVICLLLLVINLSKGSWAIKTSAFLDTFLLYITGLIGLLLLFMWFFTDHSSCDNNYNVVWALPLNFFVAFAWKRPGWAKQYFKLAAIITGLLLAAWFWLPQEMNIALLPFGLHMLYRYITMAGS